MKKRMYKILKESGEYGTSFTLCDRCYAGWVKKVTMVHEKIVNDSIEECNQCER